MPVKKPSLPKQGNNGKKDILPSPSNYSAGSNPLSQASRDESYINKHGMFELLKMFRPDC